jgi:hypothetical protein
MAKRTTSVKPATPTPAPVVEKAPAPELPKRQKYVSKLRMYHPYQNIYIHDMPVAVDLDSWLQSQIEAGIVTKC